ncbi:2-oxoglutarate synthase subunit KorA [Tepidanaerobacter acetatoxydans Re1]|uniref:2-oxoglutarate synthase subunit KorA n=1 Tax=Tepidanaerobacter acetatoxydans (strain DSM 21804 / JCM 16047 / Re1) TaxID=1209989 RepID=F4LUB7_TEPAE|nr:2-oxoacid:acceptor oxidoreductase subunit alpha [Tepidanaerobacter acetatoxydans]AEE91447.1 2-oxoglutarate synthase [Tepidanaerobacter acetatoxydans Re1]CCP26153.1 2-oxoglutarate synthase subunit KorA [Tepidanaerobacter acetatoxydans Re1]
MLTRKIMLMQGNEACVEGALAAGMRFFAGYPITPSTEIAEIAAEKLPKVGGKFIQMEDELASMGAVVGASLAGLKAMTATSGPGFSLKQENIGFACLTEVPCVVVNVQRGGPSTGLPTLPAQGDVMQTRWGTHGDHPIIVISPSSVREVYDMTIRAFNLSEKYRVPCILLMDEVVAHMRERVELPEESCINIINRKKVKSTLSDYKPYMDYDGDGIPPMANFGDGTPFHVTGLIHDISGFPSTNPKVTEDLLNRLMNKINNNIGDIIEYEKLYVEDAKTVIVTFGSTARSVLSAIRILRQEGFKIGMLRLKTIWPFAHIAIEELMQSSANTLIVAEMNYGQLLETVKASAEGAFRIYGLNKYNGELITPQEVIDKVREVAEYA